jgi:hypothetical protein
MMKYCRPGQKNPGDKRFDDWFGNVKLLKADPKGVKRDPEIDVYEYRVDIEGVDKRTKAALKGGMAPRVVLERIDTPEGKRSVWGIDIDSAAPMWEL